MSIAPVFRPSWIALGLFLCGVLLGAAYLWHFHVRGNFAVVRAGSLYRSGQLRSNTLRDVIGRYGVRTVLNLRGAHPEAEWYQRQTDAIRVCGIEQIDIAISEDRLPWPAELRALVAAFDRESRPMLVHCWRGADRSGLACAVAQLLAGEAPDVARRQLSLRYGHLPWGRFAKPDDLLSLYDAWLASRRNGHTPDRFREWAAREYAPHGYRAGIEVRELPRVVAPGERFRVSCLVRNPTQTPWQFHHGARRGVRLSVAIPEAAIDKRAGFFERTVLSGQSIDLSVQIDAPTRPGRYAVIIDLVDEGRCWFRDAGSEPIERVLEVAETASSIACETESLSR
jgi:predicted protein tyrosine phosphatase